MLTVAGGSTSQIRAPGDDRRDQKGGKKISNTSLKQQICCVRDIGAEADSGCPC